jgi:predicted small integral membrane protein
MVAYANITIYNTIYNYNGHIINWHYVFPLGA